MPGFPNFIILGAAKCGTTALYEYLRQHPQVFMSAVKEPHFFCYEKQTLQFGGPDTPLPRRSVTQPAAYQALFDKAHGFRAVGEASPFYLYLPQTAENIHKQIPHARLIAILRNPIERAFSNYQFLVRDKRETLPFQAALQAETQRIAENWEPIWHYAQLGLYSQQLERYQRLFDPAQLRVYLYDDFQHDGPGLMRDLFRFIGVDDAFLPDMTYRPNPSGRPKNRLLHALTFYPNIFMSIFKRIIPRQARRNIKQTIASQNLERIPFDPAAREHLVNFFRPEILRLQDLLGRDLGHWLNPHPGLKPKG